MSQPFCLVCNHLEVNPCDGKVCGCVDPALAWEQQTHPEPCHYCWTRLRGSRRPCICDNVRKGSAYTKDQCQLCWLFYHDEDYNAFWNGGGLTTRPTLQRTTLLCIHLGGPTGETAPCPVCPGGGGNKTIPLLKCAVHGTTTGRRGAPGHRSCFGCKEYSDDKRVQLQVTAPGIGDHIFGLVAAAGLKKEHPEKEVIYAAMDNYFIPWIALFDGYDKAVPKPVEGVPTFPIHDGYTRNGPLDREPQWEHYAAKCGTKPVLPKLRPVPRNFQPFEKGAEHFRGFVSFCPWSSTDWKDWALGKWLELEALLHQDGIKTVILDHQTYRGDVFRHSERFFGRPPWEVACLLKNVALHIGHDSGMTHLAGMIGSKVLALCVGGGLPGAKIFGFYPRAEHLDNIATLPVEDVYSKVLEMLSGRKKFVVGIPTLNRYELLDQCIESVFNSSVTPEKVLVIDNGGSYQAKRAGVEVIKPARNLGVAASWNLIHKLTKPRELIILNDDLRVGRDVLEKLLDSSAPVAVAAGWSAFRQKESVWETVGEYDERFPAYYEDNDYSYRLKLAGLPHEEISHGGLEHTGSATLKSFTPEQKHLFDEKHGQSKRYYLEKWGGLPGEERHTQPFGAAGGVRAPMEEARALAYKRACAGPSDIYEHLPVLFELAKRCKHVTEFGRGRGNSTRAFLYAAPERFVSYDIAPLPGDRELVALVGDLDAQLLRGDTRNLDIEETDLLFIDTHHTYEQVHTELERHGAKARKYLVFHDTVTFGQVGEDPGTKGLLPAIEEWVVGKPFRVERDLKNNNGLLVLERIS